MFCRCLLVLNTNGSLMSAFVPLYKHGLARTVPPCPMARLTPYWEGLFDQDSAAVSICDLIMSPIILIDL